MVIAFIIAAVLIISFFVFMSKFNDEESDNFIAFRHKADKITIDLTKADYKSLDKNSTQITISYKHNETEFKHEEYVDKSLKYVKATSFTRRETTLFIDPEDSTKIYLDLNYLFIFQRW